ncbi:MAG: hypothetical protein ABGZ37_15240, partial [Akkermansiaceae bacterium]
MHVTSWDHDFAVLRRGKPPSRLRGAAPWQADFRPPSSDSQAPSTSRHEMRRHEEVEIAHHLLL